MHLRFHNRFLRFFQFIREGFRHLAGEQQKAIQRTVRAPLLSGFRIHGFILIHIQHMQEMFPFRPVQGAIQSKAMIPVLAILRLDINVLYEHPAYRIAPQVHVTHHTAVSADGDRKLLTGRQAIIHPLCQILEHKKINLAEYTPSGGTGTGPYIYGALKNIHKFKELKTERTPRAYIVEFNGNDHSPDSSEFRTGQPAPS